MSFADSVRICLTEKYATFTGRAQRSEFWWFVLFNVLVSIAASIVDVVLGTNYARGSGLVGVLVSLALLLPYLGVAVRRLHDTDRSGWWILINLVPVVGWIVMLVFTVSEGTRGPNRFGEAPTPTAPGPGESTGYGAPA